MEDCHENQDPSSFYPRFFRTKIYYGVAKGSEFDECKIFTKFYLAPSPKFASTDSVRISILYWSYDVDYTVRLLIYNNR